MKKYKSVKIIITGGVTGGHLFPAIAIAEELIKQNRNAEILFVSIGNDFEKKILFKKGFKLKSIKTPKLKGTTIFKKIKALIKLPIAVFMAAIIVKKFSPKLIIGVGSYSSAPVLIAGRLFGIKIAICEQNIIPGITNRYLSKIANRIYITFKDSKKYFNNKKTLHTGNPLRKEIIKAEKTEKISDDKSFTVLIIGGSQGASGINKAVADSLNHIEKKQKIRFIHQSGNKDLKKVKEEYLNHKIKNTVCAFIDDIASVYQKADIIIARAGATTISEITALGKAAIYIPFPYAADGHQELNAKILEKAGACEVISEKNFDGKKMAEKLKYYGANINKLTEMGKKAKKFGKTNAVEIITDDIMKNLLG